MRPFWSPAGRPGGSQAASPVGNRGWSTAARPPDDRGRRPTSARLISPGRVFRLTLALVLWYQLAGLVFSRALGVWPAGYEAEGFFITGAALPWSLLTLGFCQPTDSILGAAVRDGLFFATIALGIATNATLAFGLLVGAVRRVRLAGRIARIDAATDARRRARSADRAR